MQGTVGSVEDAGMFVIGDDVLHEGLHVQAVIPEVPEAPLPTGRNIRREDTVDAWLARVQEPELDLGESGSSSEEEDRI